MSFFTFFWCCMNKSQVPCYVSSPLCLEHFSKRDRVEPRARMVQKPQQIQICSRLWWRRWLDDTPSWSKVPIYLLGTSNPYGRWTWHGGRHILLPVIASAWCGALQLLDHHSPSHDITWSKTQKAIGRKIISTHQTLQTEKQSVTFTLPPPSLISCFYKSRRAIQWEKKAGDLFYMVGRLLL